MKVIHGSYPQDNDPGQLQDLPHFVGRSAS